MEATLAATPSAIDFLSSFKTEANIFSVLTGALSFLGGIIFVFVTGFSREFFDERARRAKHKLNVARHVLKVCTEASTGNFKTPPRDIEHIHSVLNDLDGVNKELGEDLNNLVNLWGRIVELSSDDKNSKFVIEMLRKVEEKRKKLVDWANRTRSGN